ncbi:MAG: hypothetical protein ACUVWP_06000 [bacterium]
MRVIVLIMLFSIVLSVFGVNTIQGGLLSNYSTSVIIGFEKNLLLARSLSLNLSISYAYGSHGRGVIIETDESHHLFMPGVDFSTYIIKGKVKYFEPYLDFGGGYIFAILRKLVNNETDSDIDNGGFVKITFGSDFPIEAPVMPFVEMGAWVVVGIGGDTHTNFALLSGLRF